MYIVYGYTAHDTGKHANKNKPVMQDDCVDIEAACRRAAIVLQTCDELIIVKVRD